MSLHHPSTFIVRFAVDEFLVRVSREPRVVDREQRGLARQLLAALRFGLEAHDPRLLRLARHLARAAEGADDPSFPSRTLDSRTDTLDLLGRLELAFAQGRLAAASRKLPSLSERRTPFDLELPPAPPPSRQSGTHTFELRLVDEVGQGIPHIDAEFSADGLQVVATNAAGVALLDGAASASASVSITDAEGLSAVLEPRWAKPRQGAPLKESNVRVVVFRGQKLGPFSLKAEVPNTIVLQPPLGQLFIELWDKSGRQVHAKRKYQIDGPTSFRGVTDEQGRVKHEQVPGGDYELTLFVEPNPDEPEFEPHQVKLPLVTLAPAEAAPQVRFVGAVPQATLARLLGVFFDTNKTFLRPDGVASLADIEAVFRDNNPSQLLVVGHTDTTADPKLNDPLSLERAKSLIAFLKDDVEAWLKNYDSPPAGLPWGAVEDQAMLDAVDDFPAEETPKDRIRRFQKSRSLSDDGVAGKQTRRQLIKEYMALDASTLSDPGFDIPLTAHGCGENFPLDDSGAALDQNAPDKKDDGLDRRVELFFFDRDLGPQPAPPGKNSPAGSPQYPEWRKLARSPLDIVLEPPRRIQLIDEAGHPLELEGYELVTADGRVISGAADEEGVIIIPPGVGNEVTLRLTSMVAEVQLAAV
ncbi:MAG: hypothetical protein EOO73_18755 [Myxococcales bacterium]|nr:MAG: hypothetical protein EOO73_18755 [Myxococcales bacterium]